jgi:hypothetical protein
VLFARSGGAGPRRLPASEQIYEAIIERRMTHHDDPDLNRHAASAVARAGGRGWHIEGRPADPERLDEHSEPGRPMKRRVGFHP